MKWRNMVCKAKRGRLKFGGLREGLLSTYKQALNSALLIKAEQLLAERDSAID